MSTFCCPKPIEKNIYFHFNIPFSARVEKKQMDVFAFKKIAEIAPQSPANHHTIDSLAQLKHEA